MTQANDPWTRLAEILTVLARPAQTWRAHVQASDDSPVQEDMISTGVSLMLLDYRDGFLNIKLLLPDLRLAAAVLDVPVAVARLGVAELLLDKGLLQISMYIKGRDSQPEPGHIIATVQELTREFLLFSRDIQAKLGITN